MHSVWEKTKCNNYDRGHIYDNYVSLHSDESHFCRQTSHLCCSSWVSSRYTLSLSALKTFVNSEVTLCPHFLFLDNSYKSFDFWFSWFLVKPSLSHSILSLFWVRGTTRLEIYAHWLRHLLEWMYRFKTNKKTKTKTKTKKSKGS